MRFALAALLAVHGFIHLIGVRGAWQRDPAATTNGIGRAIIDLSAHGRHLVGLAWLVTTVLWLGAAVLVALRRDEWWLLAALGLVCSQLLIVLHWPTAKAGTWVNLCVLAALIPGTAIAIFHRGSTKIANQLLANAPSRSSPFTATDVAALPAPIGRWLERAGVIGRPLPQRVRLRQRGQMRTAADADFSAAYAEQTFTIDEPGFIWAVDVTMKGIPIVGRDTLRDGRGRMLIKAAGLVTVADGQGPKFDEGTLLRFLGEIVWFPSAALAPYIRWRAIDNHDAEARLTWRDVSVVATFTVDDQGRVTRLAARRWYNGQSLEDWVIPIFEWKRVGGIEIPTTGSALWKLKSGDLEYYRWEILDIEELPAL